MTTNPLLAKAKLPGRVFQLPSKGLFYKPGVLASTVKDGEIQVQPMSALAEIKLRSADLLFTGRALKEICSECAPEILDANQLVARDVDALFCFLRIITWGAEMSIKSMHDCDKAELHEYSANLEQIIMDPNNGALSHKDMLYRVTLSNKQTVHLRPVIFQDTIEMSHLKLAIEKDADEKGKPDDKMIAEMIVRDVMSVIKGVEDDSGKLIEDQAMISEWLYSLQKKFLDEITAQARRTNDWGFNLNVKLKCKDCGEPFGHDLELDPVNFFSG